MIDAHAFTDEYGDVNLNTDTGASVFFIITAVVVRDDRLAEQRGLADKIRANFFGSGEMKSSSIGSNDNRRMRLLAAIGKLSITSHTLAIDKRQLHKEGGFAWKKSFFKHLNSRLYERVFRTTHNLCLVADEHGTAEFMTSLRRYVDARLPSDLFRRREYSLASSESEVMLQVADILAGSWARVVDPIKKSSRAKEFAEILQAHSAGVDVWPLESTVQHDAIASAHNQDELVRAHCLNQVRIFLAKEDKGNGTTDERRYQVELLQMLLFHVNFVDTEAYVASPRILVELARRGCKLTERKLRAAVSGLRDVGVIIGASPRGYKIPVCVADVREFVSHANSIVPPMMGRLRAAWSALKGASHGELDILAAEEFKVLRALVQADIDASLNLEEPA